MGATRSKPQTAEFVNPTPMVITSAVAERIEAATLNANESGSICDKCKTEVPVRSQRHQVMDALSSGDRSPVQMPEHKLIKLSDPGRRSREIEETEEQFNKSLERVGKMFSQPIKWAEEYSEEIKRMENHLIDCYSKNPRQSLNCAALAKNYHGFIFRKHFESIVKNTRDHQ